MKALKAAQKDVETAEYRRLLYVAMTRARDELYVCGYRGKQRADGELLVQHRAGGADSRRMMPLGEGGLAARRGTGDGGAQPRRRSGLRPRPDWPAWIGRELEEASAGARRPPQPQAARRGQVERGILIHRILQHLPDLPEDQRQAHIEAAVRRAGGDPALADAARGADRAPGAGGHPLGRGPFGGLAHRPGARTAARSAAASTGW